MSSNYPQNFSPEELQCKSGGSCPYPDRLRHLAWTLQTIRDAFGQPIRVNSAYRTPEHNKAVGGARNSQHVKARAADLVPSSGDLSDLRRLVEVIEALIAGGKIPNGGVGTYSTFVHYDIRVNGPARWDS
jgi:uncharacterized protein YcbK (DUF882 family)